jgi:hypothetical protein
MKIIVLIYFMISSMYVASREIPIDLRVNNLYEALEVSFRQKYLTKDELHDWKKKEGEFSENAR